MTTAEKQWYEQGRDARNGQFPRTACPYSIAHHAVAHAWWNAGYSDADMERVGALHRLIEEGAFADCTN